MPDRYAYWTPLFSGSCRVAVQGSPAPRQLWRYQRGVDGLHKWGTRVGDGEREETVRFVGIKVLRASDVFVGRGGAPR